jgi:SAM-dependent methyltransferase
MTFIKIPRSAKLLAKVAGLKMFSNRFDGAFSIFLGRGSHNDYGTPEVLFNMQNGRSIPVYPDYRYRIKAGWRMFRGLEVLNQLQAANRLSAGHAAFLERAKGTRTITVPPGEATAVARQAIIGNEDFFLPGSSEYQELPEIKPSLSGVRNIVDIFKNSHLAMFKQLSAANVWDVPKSASILEIGFTTGGHSIFAFEQQGFRAYGIDNFYGGFLDEQSLHGYNKSLLNSKAEFVIGDITKTTSFADNSLDIVYSTSVLEHVQDLPAAFAEMYRIVKPGGAIIHNYSPYFCHDGGHALGNPDSPWAHVRMREDEYLNYIKELRPHEFEAAQDWLAHALHRNMPQWKMQRLASQTGFRIALWMAKSSPKRWLRDLTPQVINDCLAATPDIGLDDLVAQSISFVAIKE